VERFKTWLRGEYIATKKDFWAGIVSVLAVGIILILIQVIEKVIVPIVELLTSDWILQIIFSLTLITVFGLVARKLNENKKTSWLVGFMPSKSIRQKEVFYKNGDIYSSGILIGYKDIEGLDGTTIRCGIVSKATGGPTSAGAISPDYVPIEKLRFTHDDMGGVLKTLMTLGVISPQTNEADRKNDL